MAIFSRESSWRSPVLISFYSVKTAHLIFQKNYTAMNRSRRDNSKTASLCARESKAPKPDPVIAPLAQITYYHTMGMLPSTQPVATLGSSFILSSFDVACACCVPFTIPYIQKARALTRGGAVKDKTVWILPKGEQRGKSPACTCVGQRSCAVAGYSNHSGSHLKSHQRAPNSLFGAL